LLRALIRSARAADAPAQPCEVQDTDHHDDHHGQGLVPLAVGAIGVVFGDIGTSPLYSLKESFIGHHRLAVDPDHIFGVLSLMFWTMTLIVTVKYVFVILRTTRAKAAAWRCWR
jgi:KUP system potassium uptake protein